ncbi:MULTISPECIES: phosphoribosylamine--glycine ligase [unclassified Bosea (in: a-proteobacteria)]|uniref:phosphoribosylamine--glycine ligase n=1 Tax=unclassified Bosea (in: a-proteobacteria) TaxID=2653178 RepID=UPI000F7548BC|nr:MULTISPECIES: phosphoribosylamine--glycine ligase [unclassified Bosea (in: a-proteobacteria)]AZO78788.1 phosphoribosylamine--glycine ligase [Bosea sp. Tri-49]RXT17424.1 phosphoribosylamine--glycine ligase [Bosea sp. Tri-39]RXT40796.1 phosphoribosylamine--glycine ligase [Bosea sp. Tri-54]
MNILLIGSGGREHALAWAICASPLCDKLFIAPGNPGTGQCGENVVLDIADHRAVADFCKLMGVGLVVVGPEGPLVDGITDDLEAAGIKTFGPSKAAAQLEGSKAFTKELCAEFDIPTAAFARFTDEAAARAYVAKTGAPLVIKADGLAAGKGVVMAETIEQANEALAMMFSGGLGAAGAEVVIEEWMIGEEASFFALCDGMHALALASAQDHKRAFDGDTGPNTGGMGAYSPAPVMTKALEERVMAEIIAPTLAGMNKRGAPFKGILYAGLMITADGPKLIEYNTRFGDPECEVLMPRLKSDIVPALLAARDGVLNAVDLRWSDDVALTVVMAANGYPGTPEKGSVIKGIEKAAAEKDVLVFHAGTQAKGDDIVANGGRVLNVVALGKTVSEAQAKAYNAVDLIDWPGGFCRRDIGWQAVKREREG